jgi:hypothetical protein
MPTVPPHRQSPNPPIGSDPAAREPPAPAAQPDTGHQGRIPDTKGRIPDTKSPGLDIANRRMILHLATPPPPDDEDLAAEGPVRHPRPRSRLLQNDLVISAIS